jgi:signal transduction histidine kinase
MTGKPEHEGTAAGTRADGDCRDAEIREALEQDAEQATGAIDRERRIARHAQEGAEAQRAAAREAQDQVNLQADAQRRDAREAPDQVDFRADAQRRDAREAQDRAERAQDSARQESQDFFDARRDGERRAAVEQKVTDRQQADALEQANQDLEAFAFTVSHDLRAPLRAMNSYSEILLEEYGPALGDEGRACAERIQAASLQMGELIAALLRLARLTRAEVCLQPVDLGAEAAAVAAGLQAGKPGRHVRFIIQQPAWALADRQLIRTVLENLLGNAWKFTSGQDGAQIELGTTPEENSRTRCHVRDNGAGFDPAAAGKLFTAFQRLHPASQFPGTGIGLASVRQIVERHGGHVQATGAPGAGATFSFTLAAASPAP